MSTRTTIRAAYMAALKTVAGFEGRVYSERRRPVGKEALPCCIVYVEGEEKELDTMNKPRTFLRDLTLVRQIFVSPAGDMDAALDDLDAACETALLLDETLGGNALSLLPVSVEHEVNEEGKKPVGLASCTDVIQYTA